MLTTVVYVLFLLLSVVMHSSWLSLFPEGTKPVSALPAKFFRFHSS
jgi:hypothetical protein